MIKVPSHKPKIYITRWTQQDKPDTHLKMFDTKLTATN